MAPVGLRLPVVRVLAVGRQLRLAGGHELAEARVARPAAADPQHRPEPVLGPHVGAVPVLGVLLDTSDAFILKMYIMKTI